MVGLTTRWAGGNRRHRCTPAAGGAFLPLCAALVLPASFRQGQFATAWRDLGPRRDQFGGYPKARYLRRRRTWLGRAGGAFLLWRCRGRAGRCRGMGKEPVL